MNFQFNYHNRLINGVRILFRIFTHVDLQRTNEGFDRNDFIGERIKELFDGNIGFGLGELVVKNQQDLSPLNDKYIVSEVVIDTYTTR